MYICSLIIYSYMKMIFNKKILFLSFLILLLSCEKDPIDNKPDSIIITANKTQAVADGKDEIVLTVTLNETTDVTDKCNIFLNDDNIYGNVAVSKVPGVYTVQATYKDLEPASIQVEFTDYVNPSIKIVPTKNIFTSDGVDLVYFSCFDTSKDNGMQDITADTDFYVNGQKLTNNYIRSSEAGKITVSATYNHNTVTPVEIEASPGFNPAQKLYIELFAAVWCPYCPAGTLLIDEASQNSSIISVTVHPSAQNPDPFVVGNVGYNLFQSYGLRQIPSLIVNRDKKNLFDYSMLTKTSTYDLLQHMDDNSGVGISITTDVKLNRIFADVSVRSEVDIPDAQCVVMVIESDMSYSQRNAVKPELGDPIKDYLHTNVFRDSNNSLFGEAFSISATGVNKKEFSFAFDEKYQVLQNSDFVVLILDSEGKFINGQMVKVGKHIGY